MDLRPLSILDGVDQDLRPWFDPVATGQAPIKRVPMEGM
jgi:hypothetical protein